MLDIGANIGFYTSILSQLAGNKGHVHAFEPDITNFKYLKRKTSHLKNITINAAAVNSNGGKITVYVSPMLNVDHRTYEPENYASPPTTRARRDAPATPSAGPAWSTAPTTTAACPASASTPTYAASTACARCATHAARASPRCPCGAQQTCIDGACVDRACTPGARRCLGTDPSRIETCNADGVEYVASACPAGQSCSAGSCVPYRCTPNSTRCAGPTSVQACDAAGLMFGAATQCPAGQGCNTSTQTCRVL